MLINTVVAARNGSAKRRSTRMSLHAAVGLTGQDRHKAHFTMPARATNLNRHGAAIHVNREIPVGTTVTVKNQRGAQVSARVVSHLKEVEGVRTYGIEFVEQDDKSTGFWGITFPAN